MIKKQKFMKNHIVYLTFFLAFCSCAIQTVDAHAMNENYVFINIQEHSIDGRVEIRSNDLEDKFGIQLLNQDTSPQEQAVLHASKVQTYIRENLSLGNQETNYPIKFTKVDYLGEGDQSNFTQYFFEVATSEIPDILTIKNTLLYQGDRFHRSLLLVEYNQKTDTNYGIEHAAMVFGPNRSEQTLDLNNIPSILWPKDMFMQGVWHIWIGLDHILFLVAILLPVVLIYSNKQWLPTEKFTSTLWSVLKIVTVFTIAHSITLALAAFDYIQLSSRIVESVIALSIVLAALNNVFVVSKKSSLYIILVLGLFHGLGFASVMGHLPFRMVDGLKSILYFNLGVEAGQMAIVLVLFPILFLLRAKPAYSKWIMPAVSIILALIASYWFIERAFEL